MSSGLFRGGRPVGRDVDDRGEERRNNMHAVKQKRELPEDKLDDPEVERCDRSCDHDAAAH